MSSEQETGRGGDGEIEIMKQALLSRKTDRGCIKLICLYSLCIISPEQVSALC